MCGIAGYIGTRNISPERLQSTLELMRRRGPDYQSSESFYHGQRNAYLLHSRLCIIDLAPRSHQPFHFGDQVLIFNGEIYNYVEMKARLEQRGHTFRTNSDTEVLVQSLDGEGWESLDRCEGMWAFACYDQQDGSLLLSRDRFGEKPLYLYRDGAGVYFASEVKFIVSLLGRKLPINYNHLYRFLVNGYKALYKGRETFFRGLEEVPVSSALEISAEGRETLRRYWVPEARPDDGMTYHQAVTQAREGLIEAVRIRLRADVPLAFCMSGGVDSNSLISIARNVFQYDVHGFTVVNSDERYEEQDLVNQAAAELGIRHTSIAVNTSEFLPKLRRLIRQHDSPVSTITYYAHWLLMESIAEHGYRISLSGTAADELFSGYYDHHLQYLYEVHKEPALHARSLAAWKEHIQPTVRNPFLRDPDLFVKDSEFRDHIFLNADEFSGYLKTGWSEPFAESRLTPGLMRNRMLNELFHEAVPVILHEDDLNAMSYSIENRSPFLDRGLFELCYRIPSRHLVRDGAAKAVLRDSMRGIVPAPILDSRRKVGFNAPIFSFLDVKDPAVRESILDDSPIFDHLRRDSIETLIDKASLPNSESKFLFNFVSSKMFVEEFAA